MEAVSTAPAVAPAPPAGAPRAAPQLKPARVGCSGWNYRDWRGTFYPPGLPASRWLEHYASVFDTVEVNTTFYRLPSRDAVAHWVEQTPEHFVFAVKGSRYLTHMKRLTEVGEGLERFYERIEPLIAAGRLGPVLWQLPERFHRDEQRLERLLDAVRPGRHCLEFRHPSWFHPDIMAVLRAHGAALVIADRKGLEFQTHEFTADWTFVRFHYGRRGRRGNYSPTELEEWARRIDGWRRHVEVYAYFNNDWEAFAPRNALALRSMLRQPWR